MIANYSLGGGGDAFSKTGAAYRPIQSDFTTDDINNYNNTRYGSVTRGKRKGVIYLIKVM